MGLIMGSVSYEETDHGGMSRYSRQLAVVLQLILQFGQVRNNCLSLILLLCVIARYHCSVQVVDGTSL